MLRAFYNCHKRLLFPKAVQTLTLAQESNVRGTTLSVGPIAITDGRRHTHASKSHRLLLPLERRLHPYPVLDPSGQLRTGQHFRWASETRTYQMPEPGVIVCNMINMLKCVDLNDLKDAPPPAFWTAVAIGGSQLAIPILEIIGGYSPVMTLLQLHAAAGTLWFFGGMKWGLALSSNPVPTPTWDDMRWGLLPPGIALVGLTLPYPVGFIVIGSGMVTSLYLDLKSCVYPPWACAMALFITLTTITGLFFGLSAYVLFHGRDKKKKNQLKDSGAQTEEEDKDEGEEGDKNK